MEFLEILRLAFEAYKKIRFTAKVFEFGFKLIYKLRCAKRR